MQKGSSAFHERTPPVHKSTSDTPATLAPPFAFGIVAPCVYRSDLPTEANFEFLRELGLRSAVYLSPDMPTRSIRQFLAATDTELRHIGLETWKLDRGAPPITHELIKESLEVVLDVAQHPLLIFCSSGCHQTGVVVGCLRRLQRWNLTSITHEYRSFAGEMSRDSNEQVIEMFDLDLVRMPPEIRRPLWFIGVQQKVMTDTGASATVGGDTVGVGTEFRSLGLSLCEQLTTAPLALVKSLGEEDY
jgi:protein tyrosine/serine phosphatase|eukprot:SAG25_NODE_242_length_11160_cov_254.065546_2_plen_246_part_00